MRLRKGPAPAGMTRRALAAFSLGRWWLALATVAVFAPYLAVVASRAHFESPPPTPIVYDRNGTFLSQFGD
ncbi:MAG TPA: hypothetical protein VJK90_10415, partial [Acetobacteraceae bacterium]|nr:hypothetical protein [Acetobacteraceae bacterium]